MPVDYVRDAAVDVLLRVYQKHWHLDRSLDKTLRRKRIPERGRRFLTQLVYGTVRNTLLCDHVLRGLCTQPLSELPLPILVVLRMAVYQALFLQTVTRPAMVHTSVDLAKKRGHAGLGRLANAVLRKTPEHLEDIAFPEDTAAHLSLRYSVPLWLVQRWLMERGEASTRTLCEWQSREAPNALRVNTLKITPEQLAQWLRKKGIETAPATGLPEELTVLQGQGLVQNEAFRQGQYMLQDPASMLAAHLLDPKPGERILDLCAAPGGKTTHIAQLMGDTGRVLALDRQWRRLAMLRENLERLQLKSIDIVRADADAPPVTEGVFDRVLLDAPCSGLGTLRRHPELKYNMDEAAIARLAEQQKALLRSALRCVRPGGVVVYSVCTFTPEETRGVMDDVIAAGGVTPQDGPEILKPWAIQQGQYQTRPGTEALDGFFLTRLQASS